MLIIYLASFFSFFDFSQPPHIVEADKISSKFVKFSQKNKLKPFGVGGALFEDIESFNFNFICNEPNISKDEYRKLIVTEAEMLYQLANNKTAKPFFRNYPYDENQGYLGISFINKNWNYHPSDEITYVSVTKGTVFYSNHIDEHLKNNSKETYAEAYEKVYGVPLPDRKVQFGVK